jgi:hypothetical protein
MMSVLLDVIVLFIHRKFFYAVTSCSLESGYRRFEGISCLHLQAEGGEYMLGYTGTVIWTVVAQIHRRGEEIPIYITLTYSQPTHVDRKNGGSTLIQSAGMHLQDYMVSQHQRPPPEHPLL